MFEELYGAIYSGGLITNSEHQTYSADKSIQNYVRVKRSGNKGNI